MKSVRKRIEPLIVLAKRIAKERDRVCQICGHLPIDAHHIVPVGESLRLAYDPDNLVCVCRICHTLIGNGHATVGERKPIPKGGTITKQEIAEAKEKLKGML